MIVCPGLSFRLSPEHSPLFQGSPGDGRSSYSDARELLTVISLRKCHPREREKKKLGTLLLHSPAALIAYISIYMYLYIYISSR